MDEYILQSEAMPENLGRAIIAQPYTRHNILEHHMTAALSVTIYSDYI